MKSQYSAFVMGVLLNACFVFAGEDQVQPVRFPGYSLPDLQENALYYNFVLHSEQSLYGRSPLSAWSILKYTLCVWRDGDVGRLYILKVDCLSSRQEVTLLAEQVTNVTASFAWDEAGYSGPVELSYPEGTAEEAKTVSETLATEFLPLVFRSFPSDASLEVGAQWGDHAYVDVPARYRSRVTIDGWTVTDKALTLGNRSEYMIVGRKYDGYENQDAPVLDKRNSSWRHEIYHYDVLSMRNRFVTMHRMNNSGITEAGEVGRGRQYEYVIISELPGGVVTVYQGTR